MGRGLSLFTSPRDPSASKGRTAGVAFGAYRRFPRGRAARAPEPGSLRAAGKLTEKRVGLSTARLAQDTAPVVVVVCDARELRLEGAPLPGAPHTPEHWLLLQTSASLHGSCPHAAWATR